jgi:hypothetical protein
MLKHLEISLDRFSKNVKVGTYDKQVHPLLSRLYKTNKQCFRLQKKGGITLRETSISKLITNLENLKSSN